MSEAPIHWSLGYFRAGGYKLSVFCPNMHGAQIDLDRAIETFGADFVIVRNRDQFVSSYRCKTCRLRATQVDIMAPNRYESQASPGNTTGQG